MIEEKENNKGSYTVDEWLAIFKESEKVRGERNGWEPSATPFELVVSEILDMSNYSLFPDLYYGFVYFETLRIVVKNQNEFLKNIKLEIVKINEWLPEDFTMAYLGMIELKTFSGNLNWGTSIRGAWFDYGESVKDKTIKLDRCGLEFNGEQIFPIIETALDVQKLHAALLKYYDNYLVELGPDKYEMMKKDLYTLHPNQINYDNFLTEELLKQHKLED